MSRVITFSTKFPAKHPKAGQPTFFVEKMMAAFADSIPGWQMLDDFVQYDWYKYYNCTEPKHHTIRAGKIWKVGDKFSPRIQKFNSDIITQVELLNRIDDYKRGYISPEALLTAVDEYSPSQHDGKPLIIGSLPPAEHVIDFDGQFCVKLTIAGELKMVEGMNGWGEKIPIKFQSVQGGNDR